MKIISRYIDDLLDYFPVNQTTKMIRADLYKATYKDYQQLLDRGLSHEEASRKVIEQIESPEVIAKMIPNQYSKGYYAFIALTFIICLSIYQYIGRPDFLQIFYPVRMVFPDIVERLIQYGIILYISYILICQFVRLLPQKDLNRSNRQSMWILYTGTVMSALYLSVCAAFIWFSFNGYVDREMIHGGLILHFLFIFYKGLVEPFALMPIYAIINALCFVLYKHYYHLDFNANPYQFDMIYHPILDSPNEQLVSNDILVAPISEIEAKGTQPLEEDTPFQTVNKPKVKPVPKKGKKSKKKKQNIQLANQNYQKKKQ